MKNILFIFNFGSEIRQFSHSGIISKLLDEGKNVFVSLRVANDEVLQTLDKRVNVTNYYNHGVAFYISLLKEVLDEQNELSVTWKYLSGQKKFKKRRNQYVYYMLKRLLTIGAKVKWIRKLLYSLERKLFSSLYSQEWNTLFVENNIHKIVINVPNYNYHLLSTAKRLNIPVYLAFHTNKDLFVLGRLADFYTKIGVWNKGMQSELLAINKHIKKKDVHVIGCTHFTKFVSSGQNSNIIDTLGISENEIVILYIAAAPFVVQNEYDYVELLIDTLNSMGIKDYKIVVKINPMDDSNYWSEHAGENVIAMNSKWAWNKGEAFNYPKKSDIHNFIAILQRSKICVGLPSTVVIEASLMQVPFLNICFEYKHVKSIYTKISDMWFAPFYRSATAGAAIGTFDVNDFEIKLQELLFDNSSTNEQVKFIQNELTYSGEMINTKTVEFLSEDQSKMKKKKILICHSSNHIISGAEKAILDMIRPLKDKFEFIMFTPGDGPLSALYRDEGFDVYTQVLSNKRRKYPGLHMFHSLKFASYLKKSNFDFILSNTFYAAQKVSTASRIAKVPLVIYVREYFDVNFPDYKLNLKIADKIFAVSQDVKDSLSHVHNNIVVTHDFIDTKVIGDIKEGDQTLLPSNTMHKGKKVALVGRITRYKQQDLFVESFPEVNKIFSEVEYYVIGDCTPNENPFKESLKAQAQLFSNGENIHFLGNRTDVYKIMPCFDLLCMVSDREPFPRTILEAQYFNVPVVASNSGGAKEMIIDNISGYLFDVSTKDANILASRIIDALNSDSERKKFAKQAKENLMQTFATLKPVDNFEKQLNEAVN